MVGDLKKQRRLNKKEKLLIGSKWSWAGCVSRMPDELWAKVTTQWSPEAASRRGGRPRMR